MRLVKGFLVCAAALIASLPVPAGVLLQPYESPEWNVSTWLNGDPGPLRNQRGRVIVIHFFQLWCPACNDFTLPLMNDWHEQWAERDEVMVVSIHTVFEGHDAQTPARLREFVREKKIMHPVGIDKYASDDPETPVTMKRFNTGGTPHVVIVDKEGELRFSHFGRFDPYPIEAFVERLAKERGSGVRPGPPTRDAPGTRRGGRDRAERQEEEKQDASGPPRVQRPNWGDRGKPSSKGEDTGKPKEDAEVPGQDKRLSGSYQMQFQQKKKSCGTRARPLNLPVDIVVTENRLTARFQERFLGLNQLVVDYDSKTGSFKTKTMRRTDELSVGISLNLDLNGRIDTAANPPTLQFQFQLEKEGDEPGWDCTITGHGSATRSRRRGR